MKNNNKETDILEEYYTGEELSELETHVLAGRVENKIAENKRWLNRGIIKHLKALRRYMFDSRVKWYKKSIVIAALIYFISPLDTMPDFTPFLGFLDDIGVIGWTIKFMGDELKSYYPTLS